MYLCIDCELHELYFTGLVTCHAQGYAQDTSTRPPKSVYMPGTKRSAGTKIAPFWPSWTASLKFFHSLHTIIFWRTWTVETVNLISQITTSTEYISQPKFKVWNLQEDMTSTHHSYICIMYQPAYHHVSLIGQQVTSLPLCQGRQKVICWNQPQREWKVSIPTGVNRLFPGESRGPQNKISIDIPNDPQWHEICSTAWHTFLLNCCWEDLRKKVALLLYFLQYILLLHRRFKKNLPRWPFDSARSTGTVLNSWFGCLDKWILEVYLPSLAISVLDLYILQTLNLRTKNAKMLRLFTGKKEKKKKTGRLQEVSLHSGDIGTSYGIKIQASSFFQQVWCLHMTFNVHQTWLHLFANGGLRFEICQNRLNRKWNVLSMTALSQRISILWSQKALEKEPSLRPSWKIDSQPMSSSVSFLMAKVHSNSKIENVSQCVKCPPDFRFQRGWELRRNGWHCSFRHAASPRMW